MTTKPIRQRIELTEEERAGMRDFLEILEAHREESREAVLERAQELPVLARVIRNMDPEEDQDRRQRSEKLQRAALRDGRWDPYLDELHDLGALYADGAIPFADWFALMHAFRAALMPHVLDAYGDDAGRMKRVVAGMQRFLDIALEVLSESYFEAKEQKLRRYVRDLERSNRELDEFAYVASHDLRSPLRDIFNLAGWIVEDIAEDLPAESARHLELLQGRVARMERLLDDLLAYSRAGRPDDRVTRQDTAELVRDIAGLAGADGRFRVEVLGDMPVVETPRAPLEQVFLNLIGNAVKHHDRDAGRIAIEGRVQGDRVVFTVTDDGPGVSPEFRDRIFQMFQTLRPRDDTEGSGMGLALVKKIVEAHEGDIRVEDAGDASGRGARFRFTWPMRWEQETPP